MAPEVFFTDVDIRRSGDWAWVSVTPMSEKDSRNKTELNSGVMRNWQGQWAIVEFVPDSIAAAEDSEKEFRFWQARNDAVIRIYDEAGDVIETHEHAGRFQRVVTIAFFLPPGVYCLMT